MADGEGGGDVGGLPHAGDAPAMKARVAEEVDEEVVIAQLDQWVDNAAGGTAEQLAQLKDLMVQILRIVLAEGSATRTLVKAKAAETNAKLAENFDDVFDRLDALQLGQDQILQIVQTNAEDIKVIKRLVIKNQLGKIPTMFILLPEPKEKLRYLAIHPQKWLAKAMRVHLICCGPDGKSPHFLHETAEELRTTFEGYPYATPSKWHKKFGLAIKIAVGAACLTLSILTAGYAVPALAGAIGMSSSDGASKEAQKQVAAEVNKQVFQHIVTAVAQGMDSTSAQAGVVDGKAATKWPKEDELDPQKTRAVSEQFRAWMEGKDRKRLGELKREDPASLATPFFGLELVNDGREESIWLCAHCHPNPSEENAAFWDSVAAYREQVADSLAKTFGTSFPTFFNVVRGRHCDLQGLHNVLLQKKLEEIKDLAKYKVEQFEQLGLSKCMALRAFWTFQPGGHKVEEITSSFFMNLRFQDGRSIHRRVAERYEALLSNEGICCVANVPGGKDRNWLQNLGVNDEDLDVVCAPVCSTKFSVQDGQAIYEQVVAKPHELSVLVSFQPELLNHFR
eukprot:m.408840 g.408840  ORF g.408840 m.408840 type:complete len:565 (+) comp16800_c0_seq34:10024-11718(+)